jgi:hypothetical protein
MNTTDKTGISNSPLKGGLDVASRSGNNADHSDGKTTKQSADQNQIGADRNQYTDYDIHASSDGHSILNALYEELGRVLNKGCSDKSQSSQSNSLSQGSSKTQNSQGNASHQGLTGGDQDSKNALNQTNSGRHNN